MIDLHHLLAADDLRLGQILRAGAVNAIDA